METAELMPGAYRAEMRRLLDVPNRIQGELLTVPVHGDWTVKEVLVHLTGWDRAVAASAGRRAGGAAGKTHPHEPRGRQREGGGLLAQGHVG
jgi:hypothetical protein